MMWKIRGVLRYVREWWWFPESKLAVAFALWVALMAVIVIFGKWVPA